MAIRFETSCHGILGDESVSPSLVAVTTRGSIGMAKNLTAINQTLGLRSLPVYETRMSFKYIGESINEDKIVASGEESAGFFIESHDSEKDGVFKGQLAAEAAASCDARLEEIFCGRFVLLLRPQVTEPRVRVMQDLNSKGLGGVS